MSELGMCELCGEDEAEFVVEIDLECDEHWCGACVDGNFSEDYQDEDEYESEVFQELEVLELLDDDEDEYDDGYI